MATPLPPAPYKNIGFLMVRRHGRMNVWMLRGSDKTEAHNKESHNKESEDKESQKKRPIRKRSGCIIAVFLLCSGYALAVLLMCSC